MKTKLKRLASLCGVVFWVLFAAVAGGGAVHLLIRFFMAGWNWL